jgi:hypothetical protein
VSEDKTHRVYRGNHWYNDRVWLWGDAQRLPDPPPDMDISHTWVQTWFNASLGFRLVEEVEDPKTILSASGSHRVLRGDRLSPEWLEALMGFTLVAFRFNDTPGYRNGRLGVRLVEEVIDE